MYRCCRGERFRPAEIVTALRECDQVFLAHATIEDKAFGVRLLLAGDAIVGNAIDITAAKITSRPVFFTFTVAG